MGVNFDGGLSRVFEWIDHNPCCVNEETGEKIPLNAEETVRAYQEEFRKIIGKDTSLSFRDLNGKAVVVDFKKLAALTLAGEAV
ncbi:hypothetical protein E308F_30290 [Moorella sp. E308F]|uniref:hypothetical protein n=1 Tax=Moorella sp. E308F TaxID=2572682 RepID=UPI0010FFC1BE|nr:hypothetical protein [Moorella sp. E308F]GEA16783.1 hypothetical protein E308F_30290 [Moorella sp. E308F]